MGDAGRAVRARHQAGLRRAGAAVAIERLAGQVALFLVLAAGALTVTLMPGGLTLPSWVMGLIGALLSVALIAMLAIGGAGQLPGRAGTAARDLRGALRVTLLAPGALPRQVALNLAITGANLAAFAFCAAATGTMMSPVETAVLVPLILLTMILPLTVSGWGLREGAAAGLFPLIGASAQAGLAASLAFGLMFLASTLPGLLVLLAQRRVNRPAPQPYRQTRDRPKDPDLCPAGRHHHPDRRLYLRPRMVQGLRDQGRHVDVLALPDSFPTPSDSDMRQALDALQALPADRPVIIDGLAFGALDPQGVAAIRAPIVAMIHHPLAQESALPPIWPTICGGPSARTWPMRAT